MSGTPSPADYRDIVRYCYAIAVISAVSITVLVGSIFARHHVEARTQDRLENFHVRNIMLTSEVSAKVEWLARFSNEHGSTTADEWTRGSDFASQGRRASVALSSIAQALESIVLLQENHGSAEFAGMVDRARSRHDRLHETLSATEEPTHRTLDNLNALGIAIHQLHHMHSIRLKKTLTEMTAIAENRAWQFTWLIVAVMAVSCGLYLRLLHLIRARLRRHLEAEKALRERERQLQHAQKIQALGTLVGGVAHDFNNILTVILGYTQVLRSELPYGAPGAADADEVLKAGKRAVSLTRQLLAFSHYEIVERGLVDLNLSFQDMQPLLRRLIREDISLDLDLGEGVGMARVDHVQIEQILMNLVTNACHAMPDGGKLTIGTAAVELDPAEAAIRGMAPGKYSYIRVEDSGCGMSPEVRSRAFEPFFTTKKIGEGTGLGLSTIYGIVTGIDGHVIVDSEVGRGTRFDIYLPHEDRGDEDDGEDPEHIEALMGTETLLLVEDDEQVRKLTARSLREQGYHVLVCSSGVEALRLCREHQHPIHLILTDVVLPELRGPDIVERARKIRPNVAVVYMSGYTDNDLLEKVHASTDPLVPKPFELQDLLRVVRRQADRHREQQTAQP